jgi:hypothetical protein
VIKTETKFQKALKKFKEKLISIYIWPFKIPTDMSDPFERGDYHNRLLIRTSMLISILSILLILWDSM